MGYVTTDIAVKATLSVKYSALAESVYATSFKRGQLPNMIDMAASSPVAVKVVESVLLKGIDYFTYE